MAGLMRRMHEAKHAGAPVVEIWGGGQQRREFIYADDLASACVFAMQRYAGGPAQSGGGADTSIAELAHAIREVVGFKGELRFDPRSPTECPSRHSTHRNFERSAGDRRTVSRCARTDVSLVPQP